MTGNPRTKFLADVLVLNCIIRGSYFNSLTAFTSEGARAQPAVLDTHGEIVETGEPVGEEFWNVVVLSTRRYWKRIGILKVFKRPPILGGPPPEFFGWDEPGDPMDPKVGSLANATIHARHERGNEAISVETRDGGAATFAVIDADGRVIESGSDVAWQHGSSVLAHGRGGSLVRHSGPYSLRRGDALKSGSERYEARKAELRELRKRAKRNPALAPPKPRYLKGGESGGLIAMEDVDLLDLERLRSDAPRSST
ncbi:hypothetical protein [Paraburkholderia sp. EG304]|uniref:hypothetical protein n=1 Tax=Paraburkholderia sp. EG304 TaxID=3237015 RepID=UPI00397AF035